MIGPKIGTCGSAAYLRKAIVSADIATDTRWAAFRSPALALGLKACWSTPIFDASGDVLGNFAFYFKDRRGPTQREEAIVASCTSLCAIAMERVQRVSDRERRAFIDALTDLPNRASRDVSLARLSCAKPGEWALLLIDLDNLKTINDTFGHAAGDALLQTVAARVGDRVSPDRMFRMGGDEFAIIVQGVEALADIDGMAASILRCISVPALCSGHMILPRATIGAAVLSPADNDAAAVCAHADFALYHAKETDRGGFALHRPGMGSAMETRIDVIRDVGTALSENRIDAFYQPIIRLETREIVGLEALCRLRNANGEIVSAAAFHEATLDVGVASLLTERMMATVASDVRGWLAAFSRENVPLKHIVLEVTESVYLERFRPRLNRL